MATISYSEAGVDTKKVKGIHSAIEKAIFAKMPGHVLPIKGHYAGLFKANGQIFAIHCDGVGSKILVADALGKFDTLGIDCVAMNVNDIICVGARPLVLVDYLALAQEDEALVLEIMKGLVRGAQEAGCALVGGETAILPDMIKGGKRPFDLAATCVGIVEGKEPLTGEKMESGDVVIGLESSGIHSNGYTLARKLLDLKKWGKEMLAPTRIYVRPVMEMLRQCKIHGLAHITGGAFSKLKRIGDFAGVGFLLDSMPKTSGVMAELERKVSDDYEFYRTFNGGIGMCAVCPEKEAAKVIEIASKHKIKAQAIGRVVEEQDVILKKDGRRVSLL
ncbi:MAG: phosphoribosylformylglycinamidine cyclo-ligase [Candidatus Micrarchaeota archaeon]|nr:phosphoribosylformylglycinamidine cyclo-ligase [Candidatus Micrarchaeota archaeon]